MPPVLGSISASFLVPVQAAFVAYDSTDSACGEVRQSLFCKQCFILLYPDINSLGTFYPDKAAICTRLSILLLSNP